METPIDNSPADERDYEIWARDEHIKTLQAKMERLENDYDYIAEALKITNGQNKQLQAKVEMLKAQLDEVCPEPSRDLRETIGKIGRGSG